MRLGILASHPVQYNTPLFRSLAARMEVRVFFAHQQTAAQQAAAGFGKPFEWDIDLFSGYDSEFLPNVAGSPGVDRFRGCNNPAIASVIRSHRFDAFLVYGWNLLCYWQAVMACRANGIPVFVRGDSHLHTPRSSLRRIAKEIAYRPLLRAFDGFLVVGARNREYLRHYGVPEARLFHVPHHVDNEWFCAQAELAKPRRLSMRALVGARPQTGLVLFVGKFIPVKRPLDVLAACRLLHTRGHEVALVYVGEGPLGDKLRAAAAQAPFAVHFAGFRNQSELPAWYAMADVLALPSESETWGLVVNEAMACGLPTVVSNSVGCAPDLVEEGRTGAQFLTGDVHAFCDALARGLSLSRRTQTSIDLRERISGYSVEAATTGIEKALATVLQRKPNRTVGAQRQTTASKSIGS